LNRRQYEHYFFSITAALMLLVVLSGFAKSYFLAGVFRAPLPSPVLHFHGAAFTLWILLVIAQTSFVAAHRVDIHRRLGVAGFALASLMVVLGVMAGTDSLLRHASSVDVFGRDPRMFYIVPLSDMLLFATFICAAFRARFDSPAHKRFIYLANVTLLVAPIARLSFAFTSRNNPVDGLLSDLFVAALIAYDFWSTGKIHRVTLWAGGLLILVQQIRIPLGKTGAWHVFADWVILHFR
jgi:FtsH-binding integral membrane protein